MIINFHSALFALGALASLWLYRWLVKDERSAASASVDLLLVFLGGLLGARFLWAIWQGGQPLGSYFAFWDVGLISWGGILVGALLAWGRLARHPDKQKLWAALLVAILVGWTIGRLGNFLQGDAYGVLLAGAPDWWYGRVPIQLLEAGVTLVLAVWLGCRRRGPTAGRDLWWVALWYGLARILIDEWRDLPAVWLELNGSQLAALALVVCAIIGLWRHKKP
jgi:prolipoprotein diacylglyceryltransferase